MSEHFFCLYRGHLSKKLVTSVEEKFASDDVAVVNYTEPRGEKRGWFSCRNLGEPFDRTTAKAVLEYARSIANGKDAEILGGES